jgi:hypothetical protein
MRHKKNREYTVFFYALLWLVLFEAKAYAYLDPGVTSYGLQVIAASLVAVIFLARKFFRKIISFFIHGKANSNDGKRE